MPPDPSMDPTQQGDDSTGAPGMSPLVKLYMLHRSQGLSEVDAAQKAAAALRGEAETRSSFRDARDLFLHRQPTGDAYRSQLMDQSQQPVKDVAQRWAASDEAMKNTLAQGKLQATDFENQQIAEQQDPGSESSQLARQSLKSMLPNVAAGLGPDFDRASAYHIYKAVPQLKEMAGSGKDVAAAGKEGADAEKVRADTREIPKNAQTERGLKTAEAGKAGAEAEKARAEALQLSQGKPIPPEVSQKLENQAQALKHIDELEEMHGKVGPGSATVNSIPLVGSRVDTDAGRYEDRKKALAGAIAAGALPLGKETPAAMEEIIKSLPEGVTPHDRAKAHFESLRNAVRSNMQGQLETLRAGNFSRPQTQTIESHAGPAPAPKAAPGGQVTMISPEGKRVKVSADRVHAAIAAGGKLAPLQ